MNGSLQKLLRHLKIGPDAWDILLVGDGSGSGWNGNAGWACIMIERETLERHVFYGACSPGSIGFAEIMPYFQALAWYHSNSKQSGRRIHILTDSQYVVTTGKREYKGSVRANRYLWSMFDWFKRQGTTITWHWKPRETTSLNRYVDDLSRQARLQLMNQDLIKKVEKKPGKKRRTVYQRNAWKAEVDAD